MPCVDGSGLQATGRKQCPKRILGHRGNHLSPGREVAYLKDNGVIEKDIQPTKEAIVAILSEIEEGRPDDISFMLEEFVVVDD